MTNPFLKIHKSDHSDSDAEKFNTLVLELTKKFKKVNANAHLLSQFELIKTLRNAKIGRRIGLKDSANRECNLIEIQYAHRYSEISTYEMARTIEEYRSYPFFLFKHQTNLGHVLIRPETVADKISEVFNPIEIDFKNHKKFSFKYYVRAEDSDLLKKNMPDALLEYLKSKKGISIEFMNNWCLIRNDKAISTKKDLVLCQTVFDIKKILD